MSLRLTYANLALFIAGLSEEQQQATVTVRLPNDEYFGVSHPTIETEDDVLDRDHPFLVVE